MTRLLCYNVVFCLFQVLCFDDGVQEVVDKYIQVGGVTQNHLLNNQTHVTIYLLDKTLFQNKKKVFFKMFDLFAVKHGYRSKCKVMTCRHFLFLMRDNRNNLQFDNF